MVYIYSLSTTGLCYQNNFKIILKIMGFNNGYDSEYEKTFTCG